jgi:hypothetical protein
MEEKRWTQFMEVLLVNLLGAKKANEIINYIDDKTNTKLKPVLSLNNKFFHVIALDLGLGVVSDDESQEMCYVYNNEMVISDQKITTADEGSVAVTPQVLICYNIPPGFYDIDELGDNSYNRSLRKYFDPFKIKVYSRIDRYEFIIKE